MKRIFFPTDFSENANHAMRYAAHLAQKTKSQLIIIHAMHIPVIDGSTPVDTSSEIVEQQREMADNRLKVLQQEVLAMTGQEPEVICDFGFATDLICRKAREVKADMICMGTKGASNVIEQLIGSITSEVIKKSHVPVLAIPQGGKFEKLERVAFATDLSDNDSSEIRAFSQLLSHFDPEIHVVHVEINEKLASLPGHHHVSEIIDQYDRIKRVELQADDVEHSLEEYVVREHIDMLAVKRHNRGFFENLFHKSISKQLAYHTGVPLMVFHEQD